MSKKITESFVPCLTKVSPHYEDCCIFRAPPLLLQTNPKAFQPQILSVGPYHHKDKGLEMIQMHKQRYLELFLETANRNRVGQLVSMTSLENDVGALEEAVRNSYSEHVQLSREELVKMMILDGCFILMLALVASGEVSIGYDTIFSVPWILPTLRIDLLLLENQIPYIVLETLFAKSGASCSLNRILCRFFAQNLFSIRVLMKIDDAKPRHLLHLIREIQTRSSSHQNPSGHTLSSDEFKPNFILPATKLRRQGIEFKREGKADTILDIGLRNNRLVIPHLLLDQLVCIFLYNCVAFEKCLKGYGDHFSSYVVFMGFLMKDKEDAAFMHKERIIENSFWSYKEASDFFKDMSKCITLDRENHLAFESYFAPTFEVINAYTCQRRTRYWANFKGTFCFGF